MIMIIIMTIVSYIQYAFHVSRFTDHDADDNNNNYDNDYDNNNNNNYRFIHTLCIPQFQIY